MIHSAHDTQIDNLVLFLEPTNFKMENIEFAAHVIFELSYNEECLEEYQSEDCFYMKVLYNGKPLAFKDFPIGGTFPQFRLFLQKIWFTGLTHGDLNDACE
jgi:hypothetical protein